MGKGKETVTKKPSKKDTDKHIKPTDPLLVQPLTIVPVGEAFDNP